MQPGGETAEGGMGATLKVALAAEAFEWRQVGERRGAGTEIGPSPGVARGQLIALVVGVNTGIAEHRNRGGDQARVLRAEGGAIEPVGGAGTRGNIVNQEIGPLEQLAEQFLSFGALEVRDDTPF